jgi:NADH dehydrogenase
VLRDLTGAPRRAFRYRDKGSLATLGRSAAVAALGRLHVAGRPAWALWLFVHILYLIGFRNRVAVLLQWLWSYVTGGGRGARLITYVTSTPPERIASPPPARGRGEEAPRDETAAPPFG